MAKVTAAQIALRVEELRALKDLYYNHDNVGSVKLSDGTTIKPVDDKIFDQLEDELRVWDSSNTYFKSVGAPLATGLKKVKLPVFMGSLPKIKADGSAAKWINSTKGPFIFSDKEDGVSLLAVMEGKELKLYTRGKGEYGFDVSLLAKTVKGIGKLSAGQILRGELIIDGKSFASKHAGDYENARNLVSGVVNRASRSGATHAAASSATFVVHGQVKPEKLISAAAPELLGKGWIVVPYQIIDNIGKGSRFKGDLEATVDDYLRRRKEASKFDIDGLVITAANGTSFAFKGPDTEAVATVSHVSWTPSRYNVLAPTAHFVTGIPLAGVTVIKATVHNARNVKKLGIGPGAQVRITRANEVIPKVVGVVKSVKPSLPPKGSYDWDANGVHLILKKGNAETDAAVATARLTNFVSALKIEGAKDGLLRRLVAAGIDDPLKLVQATLAQLSAAGLGPTQAKNLHGDLISGIKTASQIDMMVGSALFPRGWGHRRFGVILDAVPYARLLKLARGSAESFVAAMSEIDGIGAVLAKQLQPELLKYDAWQSAIGWKPSARNKPAAPVSGPLSGSNVVFSKVRDKAAEAQITALGGEIGNSVNAKTRWLVTPPGAVSTKTMAAGLKGVPVVTLEQLVKNLGKLK